MTSPTRGDPRESTGAAGCTADTLGAQSISVAPFPDATCSPGRSRQEFTLREQNAYRRRGWALTSDAECLALRSQAVYIGALRHKGAVTSAR